MRRCLSLLCKSTFFFPENSCARWLSVASFASALSIGSLAQQPDDNQDARGSTYGQKKKPETPSSTPASQAKTPEQPAAPETKPEAGKDSAAEEHYEMAEVAPIVTHHQVTVDGKVLRYTATTGRLPIKRGDGKIDAEMFFVAYTLDGQDRPSVR